MSESEKKRDPLQKLFLEMIEGVKEKRVLEMIFDKVDEESIVEAMIGYNQDQDGEEK